VRAGNFWIAVTFFLISRLSVAYSPGRNDRIAMLDAVGKAELTLLTLLARDNGADVSDRLQAELEVIRDYSTEILEEAGRPITDRLALAAHLLAPEASPKEVATLMAKFDAAEKYVDLTDALKVLRRNILAAHTAAVLNDQVTQSISDTFWSEVYTALETKAQALGKEATQTKVTTKIAAQELFLKVLLNDLARHPRHPGYAAAQKATQALEQNLLETLRKP
jgi:hypothetical protein